MRVLFFVSALLLGSFASTIAAEATAMDPATSPAPANGSESLNSLKTVETPKDHYPSKLLFMPDGKEIATLYNLGENGRRAKVELRNVPSGEVRLTFDVDVKSSFGLAVSPDGSTIITTNFHDVPADLSGTGRREVTGRIDVWNAKTGKLKVSLVQDGYRGFTFPFFYPDGKTLAVAESRRSDDPRQSYETRLAVWDLGSGATKFTVDAERGAFHAAVSRDGKLLVTGESEVELWNPSTGEHVKTWPKPPDEKQSVRHSFAADGKRLYSLVAFPHEVWSWDVAAGKVVSKAKLGSEELLLWHLVAAPSRKFLAVTRNPRSDAEPDDKRDSAKPEILILDPNTLATLETLGSHRGQIIAMAISPDGNTVASHGADGTIRLWDVSKVNADE